jgi:hypothetical protein
MSDDFELLDGPGVRLLRAHSALAPRPRPPGTVAFTIIITVDECSGPRDFCPGWMIRAPRHENLDSI